LYSDRRTTAAAGFGASLLFTFGDETGLLDGLPLLTGLLLTGLLLTTAALLFFFADLDRTSSYSLV